MPSLILRRAVRVALFVAVGALALPAFAQDQSTTPDNQPRPRKKPPRWRMS